MLSLHRKVAEEADRLELSVWWLVTVWPLTPHGWGQSRRLVVIVGPHWRW